MHNMSLRRLKYGIPQLTTRFSRLLAATLALSLGFSVRIAPAADSGRPMKSSRETIELRPIGTYASGIFDEGGAEIVAHDPQNQQLFVINAQAATVDVLSIKNPSAARKRPSCSN